MDKPNNSCYKRVYVGDMAGSTLTVNGKPIVNNIDGDTVVGIDKLGVVDEDAFGNKFYQIDRYEKKTYDNQDTVQGLYVGRDHITAEPCAPCTNTGGTPLDIETDFCTIFKQERLGTSVLRNNILKHWIRTDIDCNPVTSDNPNDPRSIYGVRDHIRSDYGRYEGSKWVTKPTIFIDCVREDNLRVVLSPMSVGDWEFTYENGMLIAREEGYTDYLEPENNTVIYTVS